MKIHNNISTEKNCDICGKEHIEDSVSCRACNTIIKKYGDCTTSEVRNALKNAYSLTKDGVPYFKCDYTGVESHFNVTQGPIDPVNDALILTLDHKNLNKSNRGEVVVCLYIINQVKGKIPFGDFKNFIKVLSECLENKNDMNTKKIENILDKMKNNK